MLTKDLINKIKLLFLEHYLALIFALMVGLISAAPEFLAISALGRDYQGIPLFKVNDNLYYIAKIQDIVDGHFFANSPALYEYKGEPAFVLAIGELFYALPAKIFRISVSQIIVINKFLLPAVLFLLTYWLLKLIGAGGEAKTDKINALAGGLFITFGRYLVDWKNAWLLIIGQINDFVSLGWTRPVNPVTGAVMLLIFLLIIWRLINHRSRWLSVIGGLVLGSMIYYFFSWGVGLAVTAVLIVIYIIKKEWLIIENLSIVVAVNFFATSFYWYNLWLKTNSSSEQNISLKSGIILTHQPLLNKVLIACLFLFLPCLIFEHVRARKHGRKISHWWWFCLALLLGGLLALNQQIITGRTVWPYHFVQYTIPLAIIALVTLFYHLVKPRFLWLWLATATIIIFMSFVYGVASFKSYIYSEPNFKNLQRYGPILRWLNKNAPLDSVVLTVDEENNATRPLEQLIPAFTRSNVYTTLWIPWSVLPESRIIHNYLIILRMRDVAAADIEAYLYNHQDELRGLFFRDIAMANAAAYDLNDPYILEKIQFIAQAYREFVKKDFISELKKYRSDYIASEGDLSANNKKLLPKIKFINELNGIFLYEF